MRHQEFDPMEESQGSKHVTFNDLMALLDGVVNVEATDIANSPPGSPADFSIYIVGTSPTGDFTGQAAKLAQWSDDVAAWTFYTPPAGMIAYVADEGVFYLYRSGAWEKLLGRRLFGSTTYNPASLGAGLEQRTTLTVTGAVRGDVVEVVDHSDTSTTNHNLQEWRGWVESANTLQIVQKNHHSGAVDLASGTLSAVVRKA